VRRLFGWLAGAVGGAAVYRALRRRAEAAPLDESRADELRAKLAAAREAGEDPEARSAEGGETPVDKAEPLDPDARRRAVHEQGRAAIDELRGE
jgi:hypothetical protein